jgi:hypothetical protein
MTAVVAPEGLEDMRALENEVRDAERAHEAALAEWRCLVEREAALTGPGVKKVRLPDTVNAAGDHRNEGHRLVRVTIDVNGQERFVDQIDDAEKAALLDDVRAARGPAGRAVTEARQRLRGARIRHANARLNPVLDEYARAASDLDCTQRQSEAAIALLLARLRGLGVATQRVRATRRKLLRIARDGAGDSNELTESIAHADKTGGIPVEIGTLGVVTIDGPEFTLFGDEAGEQATYAALADLAWLAATDPERAEARLRGTPIGRKAGI